MDKKNLKDPFYMCWTHQDELWKDHSSWEHNKNALSYKGFYPSNRYYSRGEDITGVEYEKSCDKRRLNYDRRNANRVLESNNPWAEDFPTFATNQIFSVFGDQQLTFRDFENAIRYYNRVHAVSDGEEKYGPFDQSNYNQIAKLAYDNIHWDSAWKSYHSDNNYKVPDHKHRSKIPYLFRVSFKAAKMFTDRFNQAFYHLHVSNNIFHTGKTRVLRLSRSSQTGWLRYSIVTSVTKGIGGQAREFEFYAYYDPMDNKLVLGPTKYLGVTTTDKLLLPPGFNKDIATDKGYTSLQNAGRPLHPLQAKESELIGWNKASSMYKDYMRNQRSPKQPYNYDNSIPYWFRYRNS